MLLMLLMLLVVVDVADVDVANVVVGDSIVVVVQLMLNNWDLSDSNYCHR